MNVHFSYKVNKTPDIEKEINQQIEKIRKRLQVFRPELIHLKGIVEQNSAREGFLVSLNLRLPSGQMADFNKEYGYDWAFEMNDIFKEKIGNRDHAPLLKYEQLHHAANLAIPTPDHYYPLLYALPLQDKNESVSFFNDKVIAGAFTMTSVKIA